MKRILFITMLLLGILSLSACYGRADGSGKATDNPPSTSEVVSSEDTSFEAADTEEEITTEKQAEVTTEKEEPATEKKEEATTEKKEEPTTEKTEEPEVEKEESTKDSVKISYPMDGKGGLPNVEFTVIDPSNARGLSTKKYSFSFGAAKNEKPHSITVENQKVFDSYGTNALAWDNKTNGKILYLTFDCGYEYKNLTSLMLDTLSEKGVKGAFFCTLPYIKEAPEVVARMINEGHIVGNHTVNHPSDSATLSRTELARELLGVHNYLRVNFGYDSEYFRFPTGAYSENAIELVDSVGYKSVFWSIAHTDWDPEDQPGVDKSFQTVTERLHPGAVILLHTTSPDNAQILGDFIDYARNQGYEFRTLDQYGYWK